MITNENIISPLPFYLKIILDYQFPKAMALIPSPLSLIYLFTGFLCPVSLFISVNDLSSVYVAFLVLEFRVVIYVAFVQLFLAVGFIFLLLFLDYYVFLPVVVLENSFVLPDRLALLISGAQKDPLCLVSLRFEQTYEYDFIRKLYFAESYLEIFSPRAFILSPIRVNTLPMTIFISFFQFTLVYFSRSEDIRAISVHIIIQPVPIVKIISIEQIQSLSFLLTLDHLSKVDRAILELLFCPSIINANVAKGLYYLFLVHVQRKVFLETKVFQDLYVGSVGLIYLYQDFSQIQGFLLQFLTHKVALLLFIIGFHMRQRILQLIF